MKFGDLLKARRTARQWTQPQAAEHIGIEQSYLSKLETGKAMPSEDVYGRLVAVYDLDADVLATSLYPAELDKLRSIAAVRDAVLDAANHRRRAGRLWLIAGLAALALGGGLLGLAQLGHGGQEQFFTYQVVEDASTVAADTSANSSDDGEIRSTKAYRGPRYSESLPDGQRVWSLIGGYEAPRVGPYRLAIVPACALLLFGLGCFFVSWRWR